MAQPRSEVSWASSAAVRKSMQGNRRRDTAPEMAVRRLVHAAGLRYRVDYAPLPEMPRRKADLVFTRAKVAVFIDGCFWHGCPEHRQVPKTNAQFWSDKIATNQARDMDMDRSLTDSGWTVIRCWEHEDPFVVASAVADAVGRGERQNARDSDRDRCVLADRT
nr:very short patch repair endonuclease [Gordonia sp. X0973]